MAEDKDNAVEYRMADHNDETDILAVLEEVAPEIPVVLDGPERQEKIRIIVSECCHSGASWVAVDAGKVVGFVLAKPDILERFCHKNEALSLRYIGVSGILRQRGIFATLMEKLTAKGSPLTASVLHTNQSAMAHRLMKIGFTKVESNERETRLRWVP